MDNGLYFLRVQPVAGGKAANGGVLVLRNGRILGGDAFFYYDGSYSSSAGSFSGEFGVRQHARSPLAVPVFGANEVTVAFSGICSVAGADVEATSPSGSYRIAMHRIADA